MKQSRKLWIVASIAVLFASVGQAWAQKSYDDRKPEDRFYIRLGGFEQTDIKTTLNLAAKTPQGGLAAGAIVVIESLFDVDDSATTVRLDGWYRFSKKNRINWTYWRTDRQGINTYSGDSIEITPDFIIMDGDTIKVEDQSTLFAISYTYSFLNTSKYELWLGGGFNTQTVDTQMQAMISGGEFDRQEEAKGTIPIPVFQFGLRWNFSPRWRMMVTQELFGLKIGDFSGKLSNTRVFAEVNLTRHFGLGAGFDRYNFDVEAESDDFLGSLAVRYTGLSIYLKGQI